MMRLRQVLRKRCGKPWPAPTTPSLNILPSRITTAQSKASSNTSQWQSFKSRLDGQLNSLVGGNSDGFQLTWVTDFALGYQALHPTDPTTAAKYADKAVALVKSGITDMLDGVGAYINTWLYLARGDGTTTSFTLPATPLAGTFQVQLQTVAVKTMTRGGTPNTQDQLDSESYTFLKVSKTSDGAADYVSPTDWLDNPDYYGSYIDWSPGGAEPTAGATYYITVASCYPSQNILSSGYTQSGTTLTFTTPPAANQAIYVRYMYNDGTNAYRQTADGRGGFRSLLTDGFRARNLVHLALAYDWLYDYAGFDATIKSQLGTLLSRWSQWLKDGTSTPQVPTSPYKPAGYDGVQSNYTAAYYFFRAAAGATLNGRGISGGSTVLSDIVALRTSYMNQGLRVTPPNSQAGGYAATYLGGWWAEGWEYGPNAITGLLRGSDILADAGAIANLTDESAWAGEVLKCLVHSQATTSWFYPGGDVGGYPPTVPPRDMAKIVGALSSDSNAAGYAVHYQSVSSGTATADAFDLLYYDPTAASVDWTTTEPDYYYAQGDGLVLSRKDWTYGSMWCSFELGDYSLAGHNTYSTGTVLVNRGGNDLLVCATEAAVSESSSSKNINGNFVLIGTSQVNPGLAPNDTLMKAFEGTAAYTYAEGDYKNAYYTGGATPATELTRVVFHVRGSDYLFLYDRAATTSSATAKQLQWYFNPSATLTRSTDAWICSRGTSKLFGKTFSSTAITSANDTPSVVGVTMPRVTVNPTSTTTSLRYASVMQAAPSATAAMDASAFVVSTAGAAMEGVLIGTVLVLFGKTLTSAGATGYQMTTPTTYGYTAPGGTLTHYVCDLTPNHTYTLSGSATGTATASAAGVLTFTTSGSGSQTVTIT